MNRNHLSITLLAASLLGGCAAIPPGHDYVSCAGSSKYKVCKRVHICGPGESVFAEDHYFDDKLHKTVVPPCSED